MIVNSMRLKVIETITTVNGTLYKNEVVKVLDNTDNNYRVKDSMGRIWFVNPKQLSNSPVALSRGESK